MKLYFALTVVAVLCLALSSAGQSSSSSAASIAVPPVIQFSNIATNANGVPLTGTVPITFSLYNNSNGGEALWAETQNVTLDSLGHYSVYVGITKTYGLPASLFTNGEAHWLGVKIADQAEQPRVYLVSVPYAMKAGDAATVGGLPPSAFVLAAPSATSSPANTVSANTVSTSAATSGMPIAGSGTLDFIPLWTDNSGDLGNSVLFQSGSGSTAKIGINTTKPASTLDIRGSATIRGLFSLPALGTSTAAAAFNSQPMDLAASAFNSGSNTAVTQTFQWQAEPANSDTSNASGTLNLLFGQGTGKATETGLHIASNGQITFALGQTFPGTGNGTITGVTAGSGLSGGGTSGTVEMGIANSGVTNAMLANSSLTVAAGTALTGGGTVSLGGTTTLNLDTTQVPFLSASNTFTGNQTVNGNLSATGVVTGSGFQIGSNLFDYGSYANLDAFLGFAGNPTITGTQNTAVGEFALAAGTSGGDNTAVGSLALASNTSGNANTANGEEALRFNTTGFSNTATGVAAIVNNTTGADNDADGTWALSSNTTGNQNTAIGPFALEVNTTGSNNTAVGFNTGIPTSFPSYTTGSNNTFLGASTNPGTATTLNNATAIGANAQVTASNSMVLGSINGVNGATASTNVGIGTTAPAYTLDVHGTGNFTGPITFGSAVTFASGQTFPLPNGSITNSMLTNSAVTISPGTGLTGGGAVPLGQSATLNVDTTKIPLLAASNTFTGNQTVNGNLSATGVVTGSGFQVGSNLFDYGSVSSQNAFLGFAGNTTMTGTYNTAAGSFALLQNTTGGTNTAIGQNALAANTTGNSNTAVGFNAVSTSTDSSNTGLGAQALWSLEEGGGNTGVGANGGCWIVFGGSNNTFVGANTGSGGIEWLYNSTALGFGALVGTPGATLSNGTAIGAYAQVAQANSMVLGSINGVNGATADTAVGIGTTTPFNTPLGGSPATKLNIVGNSNIWVPLVVQSSSTFGTWIDLNNTSSGGKNWAILAAGPANGEGAGNLAVTSLGAGGTIILEGNVQVTGTLSKGGGSFQIDHPLDPANKYLYHSFVESPDMMNVYNGNVTTDRRGLATVQLPKYFEALNRDFRYQLTVIGQFAQAIVAKEIDQNRFTIRTNRPGVKVSWQVTGIRHDAYADAHRIPVEEDKPAQEQGRYLHPELFGAAKELAIGSMPAGPSGLQH